MPEGPSIVLLREEIAHFSGKIIRRAEGNAKIDMQRVAGKRVKSIRSFGKQTLIALPGFAIRIHLLMFGSYRVDERKDAAPRLSLGFHNGELNFYSCSVRLIDGELDDLYDWRADIMSDSWDPKLARKKLMVMPDMLVCDALLDQNVFAGVGNIIKNEVLYRIKVHPLSTIGALPPRKLGELIKEAREYSFQFLEWKRAFVLRKHWLVHNRSRCPIHDIPLERAHLGKTNRRTFWCDLCQKLYEAD
ncbi:DNA-formamidopyrimidine glycosylase family protein [Rhodanobacter sp. L36]|uniref:DNA-formamidopyrimidine glycosylase family protein n=1 Tax=Rhodanobacter sp. L36 TaxID=1747221 RepID=UPI00131C625A|nr:DNA-formamidopyrimidine glycosylase family protein [Rhodanobacter sp. L36]